MEGARKEIQADFHKKCQEASYHVSQMERHSPRMNAVENGMRELKKGSSRQMLKKHSPNAEEALT
jgi:hypothetical protein